MSLFIPLAEAVAAGPTSGDPGPGASLADRYRAVRRQTEALAEPLEPEDFVVQSMPDASPAKWHLAHTAWFFETFLLKPALTGYRPRFPEYDFLFNSYYNAIGERIGRDRRGLLSRPTIGEVLRYRREVDDRMADLLGQADPATLAEVESTVILGLHHEQQHQELLLTDIKHAFASNPLRPAYRGRDRRASSIEPGPIRWHPYPAGVRSIGHEGAGFAFDNETPRHPEYLGAFELASRPTTNAEYLAFLDDGGYDRPESWLSDGWGARNRLGWTGPLYWERAGSGWKVMTLAGLIDLDESEPVCHVSYYEADAFARWAGARLATEAEWETAAAGRPVAGNLLESGRLHPAPTSIEDGPAALFGDVWEWTRSPYTPYPGYRPAAGALGEYNGKFMCNQMILRGGSCATPRDHIRPTYRNFFGPEARWQFTGIRLARDPG